MVKYPYSVLLFVGEEREMNIENLFISSGANTVENGITYLKNILSDSVVIAYATQNMIAIVNFHQKVRLIFRFVSFFLSVFLFFLFCLLFFKLLFSLSLCFVDRN